jgi:hypothetical protein
MFAAPVIPQLIRELPDRWQQRIAEGRESLIVDTNAANALEAAANELRDAIAKAQDATRMLTTREFAELRGVREATVRKWCARGELAGATKNISDDWRIPVAATRIRRRERNHA